MKREQLEQILAEQLIELPIGERLPTVRELADKYDVSVGAIQNALTMIKDKDMVRLDYRGWKGTTLGAKNVSLLWNMAARGEPLVVALPLPSTLICEGLATAIKTLFSAAGIEVFMIFVRGSRYRIRALREKRCHIVVISSFSAREMCEPSEMTVLELPAHTYVKEHRVFYTEPAATFTGKLRVVIDRDSADLQRLTEVEFEGSSAEFIPATYTQYARLLAEGRADAAIWDTDEAGLRVSSQVQNRPLSDRVRAMIGDTNTQASFVARSDARAVGVIVRECLGHPELLKIQNDVLTGKRVPGY